MIELNIDGLVGPTHHYGGLGVGNLASRSHAHQESFPQAAALEGLDKMWRMVQLGLPQAFLPPSPRPNLRWLADLGFTGSLQDQLTAAADQAPQLLAAAYSSASMWTANVATVSPANDCRDGHLHISIANLASNLHREQEAFERLQLLRSIFSSIPSTVIHNPLPASVPFRDEGAANHMRLSTRGHNQGIEVFVYGSNNIAEVSHRFTARQSLAASQALARRHQLDPSLTFFLQQNPAAIDAGVFHNDVIATSHENFLFYHEDAFVNADEILNQISHTFEHRFSQSLIRRCVKRSDLSLSEAVSSYLFNSQIVSPPNANGNVAASMHLVAPNQCETIPSARRVIQTLVDDAEIPIESIEFIKLDQSMANGGGPACLRLRVVLTVEQFNQFPTRFLLNNESYPVLRSWILHWYPERISLKDFSRAEFAKHSLETVNALQDLLGN